MQFKEGADVKTVDGDKVGTVDQIVVDPSSNKITHVVVEKGFLFTEDRVVPVEALRDADDDEIVLKGSVDELETFPEFKETYYISPNRERSNTRWSNWHRTPLFYYPPAGTGYADQYHPYPAPVASPPQHKHTVRNIPDSSIVIDEGTKVTAEDGEHAGDVLKAIADADGNITHILISKGFLFTTERLIPLNWVDTTTEEEIRLFVPTELVEDLPEYDG